MKYLNKITLGLILCMGLMTSCKDDDEIGIPGGIAVDREEITIVAEGGTEKIAVSSNSNWCQVHPSPGYPYPLLMVWARRTVVWLLILLCQKNHVKHKYVFL